MAKRRRLTAPDEHELQELEEGFAAKPALNPFEATAAAPPIAKVAGEAASLNGMASVTDRVALAQDQGDASKWRNADQAGLVAQMIPVAEIDQDFIRRDRLVEDDEAMHELRSSILSNGLRAPIEVARTDDGYGLISGFRRLRAFTELSKSIGAFGDIPAFVRSGNAGEAAYVSMVEENEVRADLTHYERGRIAVLAAGQGVFPDVAAAVDVLFAAASKAKRSKVRSFATVHEALGDLLKYPTALTEKGGLQLAAALRDGAQPHLRAALGNGDAADPTAEWNIIQSALTSRASIPRDKTRGGRPQKITRLPNRELENGGVLSAEMSADGMRIELRGREVSVGDLESILKEICRQFE
ncbi:ParB N-terminal domain-containing protein (plasmid) [Aliisedimentitalea scapharcae]|uniref:ParB N-terminal domain-containing protein n=1 Tax=Aliisedimentitalea scapharcae TaxID=1524259 RepID=A0ABZ2XZP3_9RHOB